MNNPESEGLSITGLRKSENRARIFFSALHEAQTNYLFLLNLQEQDLLTGDSERLRLRQSQEAALVQKISGLGAALAPILAVRGKAQWTAALEDAGQLMSEALVRQERNRKLAASRLNLIAGQIKQNRAALARAVRQHGLGDPGLVDIRV
ncbi:MAG: hypothetical protein LBQ61_08920 [Spirochaetales bacterium]|jgi:hypothetical protein|nr:hypothetical protein [Spirochaetales bacterium]